MIGWRHGWPSANIVQLRLIVSKRRVQVSVLSRLRTSRYHCWVMRYILSDRLGSSLYTGCTRDLLVLLGCFNAAAGRLLRPTWLAARISWNVRVMHETWVDGTVELTLPALRVLHVQMEYLARWNILVRHVLHHFLEALGLLDDGIIWIPIVLD